MSNIRKAMTALVLLAAAAAYSVTVAASSESDSKAAPGKFVGTFFGITTNVMASFHADGTFAIVDPSMFNFLGNSRSTPALGVWRHVGGDAVRVTYVFFSTEPYGENYLPNGLAYRVTLLARFEDPVNGKSPSYTTSETEVAVFSAGQNPTTDAPFLVVPFPDGGGTRLGAE